MGNKLNISEKYLIIGVCIFLLFIGAGLFKLGYYMEYSNYEKEITQNIVEGFTKQDVVFDLHSVDKYMVISKDNTYYTVHYDVRNKNLFQEIDKVSINCWYNENTNECRFESGIIQSWVE